jgi:hypothetical protein
MSHLRQDGEVVGLVRKALRLQLLPLPHILRPPPPLHVVVHARLRHALNTSDILLESLRKWQGSKHSMR